MPKMAILIFNILCIFYFPFISFSAPMDPENKGIYCEASPSTADSSWVLFCHETDQIDETRPNGPKLLPDLKQALQSVVLKLFNDNGNNNQYQMIPTGPLDPANVTQFTLWASFDYIQDNAFEQFPNLRNLQLAQFYGNASGSVNIADNALDGLPKLVWLGLHVNLSGQGIPNAIQKLTNLQSLALYEADLRSEFKMSPNWINLKYLTIYDSPNMTMADDAFQIWMDNLKEIELNNINLQIFPKSMANLQHLTRVEIENTQVQEIPSEIFTKSASTLETIRLSKNRISVLHPNSFRDLSNLIVLQLGENQIDTIPQSIFDELGNLEVLNLAGNKISSLPDNIFDRNQRLNIFDLDENPIQISGENFLKQHGHNIVEGEVEEERGAVPEGAVPEGAVPEGERGAVPEGEERAMPQGPEGGKPQGQSGEQHGDNEHSNEGEDHGKVGEDQENPEHALNGTAGQQGQGEGSNVEGAVPQGPEGAKSEGQSGEQHGDNKNSSEEGGNPGEDQENAKYAPNGNAGQQSQGEGSNIEESNEDSDQEDGGAGDGADEGNESVEHSPESREGPNGSNSAEENGPIMDYIKYANSTAPKITGNVICMGSVAVLLIWRGIQ